MSGDITVRKRRGKNKKKETDVAEQFSKGTKSDDVAFSVKSSLEFHDTPAPAQHKDLSEKPTGNGSKKKHRQSPNKETEVPSSGFCAKMLTIFLVTLLVVLAGLIFMQLHPEDYPILVKDSQDFKENVPKVMAPVHNVHDTAQDVHIKTLESQILHEEQAKKLSAAKLHPQEVVVDLPKDKPSGVGMTPVQEEPIVKKTAHVLGEKDEFVESNALAGERKTQEDNIAKPNKTASFVDLPSNPKDNIHSVRPSSAPSDVKNEEPKHSGIEEESKAEKKRKSRKAPPSAEELLAHHNTIERCEMLMSAIAELSPEHPMLTELRPHIDGAREDLKSLKLKGLEGTTKHALIILEDLYVRLLDAKDNGEEVNGNVGLMEEVPTADETGNVGSIPLQEEKAPINDDGSPPVKAKANEPFESSTKASAHLAKPSELAIETDALISKESKTSNGKYEAPAAESETLAVESETQAAVESETPAAVESETPAAVESETPAAVESESPAAVESETQAAVESETPAAAKSVTRFVESETPAAGAEFESRAAEAKSETATVESKTPAVESKTPAVETKTPAVETKTPAVETKTPAVETKTPAVESKTPAVESKPAATEPADQPAVLHSAKRSPGSVPSTSHSPSPKPASSSSPSSTVATESAPRELQASRSDIGLEDLTEEDLVSSVDSEDQLEKLHEAEQLRLNDPYSALREFTAVVREQPLSARAALGRAQCLDAIALAERSNDRLEQAIASYRSVLEIAEDHPELVSERLLRAAANTLVDKLRFRGHLSACVSVQKRLLRLYPDDAVLHNQLGITLLLQGQPAAAQRVFEAVLQRHPNNGLAQVHLGFILKTTRGNNTEGARLMKAGLASQEPGTDDARFFFHLGDALQRLGRPQEAHEVYVEAAAKGLFLRPTQRSLYNVDRLTAKPVWTLEETTYKDFLRKLEENWKDIRDEGLALISAPKSSGYQPEAENLRDRGAWGQLELYSRGRQNRVNCARTPKTCAIVGSFEPAAGCRRGQIKFSLMEGGTHVWAHCGPTNCRLRAHLGLVVPKTEPVPVIRVEDQYLTWREGEVIVFDDSFEHEVWHNGTEARLVLIVDLWHPELSSEERAKLSAV